MIDRLYPLLRAGLFRLDPETAHHCALTAGRWWPRVPAIDQRCECMGLTFPNPIGLAAGLDKDAEHIDALSRLGFGFIEVGTVTPRAQPGNPPPRLFRLPRAKALINRMGFNNRGVDHLVEQLRSTRASGIIGVNIGKNRDTPIERASEDYRYCLERVYPFASYVTINISSPNTPGLRDLQAGHALDALLVALKDAQADLSARQARYVPLAVKIAPDLDREQLDAIAESVTRHRIDAIIATNTTANKDALAGQRHADEAGGLSGAPLRSMAQSLTAELRRSLGPTMPIIGVGGIMNAADACARFDAGANLVQLYTGLLYRGPRLIREIGEALAARAHHTDQRNLS